MVATRLTLTDFIDFLNRPGMSAKLAKVREIKHRGPYTTTGDFYRPIREAVIRTHASGRDKWSIRSFIARLAALGLEFRHRLPSYELLADAYIGWWGRKRLEWFEPGWQLGDLQGLQISVNPELGLDIEGSPHLVKLYFKEDLLSPRVADVAGRMMARVLGDQVPPDATMAVLDVRRKRLHRLTPRPDLDALLDAEVAAFTAMWAAA